MTVFIFLAISWMLVVAEGTVEFCVPLGPHETYDNRPSQELEEKLITDIKTKLSIIDDPIYFDHLDLDVVHEAISINGTMDAITIYGITDLTLCLFSYDDTTLNLEIFNLTFNSIDIKGVYNIDGNIGDLFNIFGNGTFWFDMLRFSIAMANFNVSIAEEMCVSFDINVHLQEVKNYFHHFMGDMELEVLLNHTLQAIIPESIDILWQEFKENLNIPVDELINDLFNNGHFMELLKRKLKISENIAKYPGTCFDI